MKYIQILCDKLKKSFVQMANELPSPGVNLQHMEPYGVDKCDLVASVTMVLFEQWSVRQTAKMKAPDKSTSQGLADQENTKL